MSFFTLILSVFLPCAAEGGRAQMSKWLCGCLSAAWGQTTAQTQNKILDVPVQKLEYMAA